MTGPVFDDYSVVSEPVPSTPPLIIGFIEHLPWVDRYPFTGEVKGGQVMIAPGDFQLIITSNFKPEQCFRRHEDICAIRRRFTFIRMTEQMTQNDPFDIPVEEVENPTVQELEE